MHKSAAIGIFDSGLGGLTVLPFLKAELPHEQLIYFGDTARTPYGSKSAKTILKFSSEITDFLLRRGIKALIIACNTATAIALPELRKKHPELPIFGIIQPVIQRLSRSAAPGERLLILGTKTTINSGLYESGLKVLRPDLELGAVACPTWVPLLEEGVRDGAFLDAAIQYHLPLDLVKNYDSLLLGCTHYPLLKNSLQRLYPGLKLYDPSESLVPVVKEGLSELKLLAEQKEAEDIFYASDLSSNFLNMITELLPGTDADTRFRDLSIPPEF
ncbi:MAG: glutamate racemase [Eubacteriales bacterium]|nr:glutamate racemase [Eubacteriales bacterium]